MLLFNVYGITGLGVFRHLLDVVCAMWCNRSESKCSNSDEDIGRFEAVPCLVAAGAGFRNLCFLPALYDNCQIQIPLGMVADRLSLAVPNSLWDWPSIDRRALTKRLRDHLYLPLNVQQDCAHNFLLLISFSAPFFLLVHVHF